MARSFKEVAHLRTDIDKYSENYDRIFGGKNVQLDETLATTKSDTDKESEEARIKDLAREEFINSFLLGTRQDTTEGIPESSSFICGFIKGYNAARGRE
jgi:hypothetical protein